MPHLSRTAACLLALLSASSSAQSPSPKQPEQGVVVLAPDPLRVEAVGVTIGLPLNSVVENQVYDKIASTRIMLPEELGFVVIQERRTRNLQLETTEVADDILSQLLAMAPLYGYRDTAKDEKVRIGADGKPTVKVVGTRGAVVSRDKNFDVGGYSADHAYVEIPVDGSHAITVRGSTLIKTAPGTFILFELFTPFPSFERARQVYEVMLASAEVQDPADMAARRAAAVSAGVRALARLTEDDYREVFESHGERWERLFRSSPTGSTMDEEELGYRRISASLGSRGDLSPKKPRDQWSPNDMQPGYVVRLDARLLEAENVIDSRAIYFLSLDRREESWVVNMAIRNQEGISRWQELGARSDEDMSVQIIPKSAAATTIRPQIQGEGYLSMVESFMLPQLLARVGVPTDYAFYAYQTNSGTIRMRTDVLEASSRASGRWILTTKLNADAVEQRSTVGQDGVVLQIEYPDGRQWQSTTLEQLVRIWKSKGLPMD